MKVADLFYSIQGEGLLAGVPSAFVRTTGCNLRCHWCDTPYTSWQPEGDNLSVTEVLQLLAAFPTRHVVVTGGEPLLMADLGKLCLGLRERGYHITVETAATIFQPIACDLASLSPKLANSTPWQREAGRWAERHESLRLRLDVIQAFMHLCAYQLKFVVERAEDLAEIGDLLDRLPKVDRTRVLLMPQAVTREELIQRGTWLAEVCKEQGFRYCPRLHIELYGNQRST